MNQNFDHYIMIIKKHNQFFKYETLLNEERYLELMEKIKNGSEKAEKKLVSKSKDLMCCSVVSRYLENIPEPEFDDMIPQIYYYVDRWFSKHSGNLQKSILSGNFVEFKVFKNSLTDYVSKKLDLQENHDFITSRKKPAQLVH